MSPRRMQSARHETNFKELDHYKSIGGDFKYVAKHDKNKDNEKDYFTYKVKDEYGNYSKVAKRSTSTSRMRTTRATITTTATTTT
jgi:hypothetical protein